jgi:uncharacterized protein YigE (DUF2233 family)
MNTSSEVKIALLMFAMVFLLERAVCQTQWLTTTSGCEVHDGNLPDHGVKVPYVLVRCDPKVVQIRVADTASELGKTNGYAAFSLKEVAEKSGAAIAVNAGSTSSFSLPVPAGLLIVHGKLVSKPRLRVPDGGILCIRRSQVFIEPFSVALPKGCSDAVQRGPVFSREFANNSTTRYRRTAAAVDKVGRFIILLTREPATLSSVNSFLYDPGSALGVQSALNLDGDMSSGLVFGPDQGVKETAIGTVDSLIASAILIRRR